MTKLTNFAETEKTVLNKRIQKIINNWVMNLSVIVTRKKVVANSAGNVTEVDYDEWGRVTTVTHRDESTVGVIYNLESMVTSVTNELSKTSSAEYDDVGQVIETTNANNESQTYEYNENGKLEGRIDWSDHGSPGEAGHEIPHFHPFEKTGWGKGRPLPWLRR